MSEVLSPRKTSADIGYWNNINSQLTRIQQAIDETQREIEIQYLVDMIPPSWRDKQFEKDLKKSVRIESNYQYKYFCGVPLGSPDEPLVDEETGKVISPILVEEEIVDYRKVLASCLSLFDRRRKLETTTYREVILK